VAGGVGSILTTTDPTDAASAIWTHKYAITGDGGPATSAELDAPVTAAPTHDGGFLITQVGINAGDCAVRKVSSGGTITTVAGGNGCGFSGDTGAATSAQVNPTSAVPTDNTGAFLIADYLNFRVRQVSDAGTITTVAGNGSPGYGSGGSATSEPLTAPSAAVPLSGGSFLIGSFAPAGGNTAVVQKVSGGILTTVAGNPNGPGGGGGGGGGGAGGAGAGGGSPGSGGTVSGPHPTVVCSFGNVGEKAVKNKPVLQLRVACDQQAQATLRAVVVQTTTTKAKAAKSHKKKTKTKKITIATRTLSVTPGHPVSLTLSLPSSVTSKLGTLKQSAQLTLVASNANGTSGPTKMSVALKAIKVKKKKP
jgi:hypothetical protein